MAGSDAATDAVAGPDTVGATGPDAEAGAGTAASAEPEAAAQAAAGSGKAAGPDAATGASGVDTAVAAGPDKAAGPGTPAAADAGPDTSGPAGSDADAGSGADAGSDAAAGRDAAADAGPDAAPAEDGAPAPAPSRRFSLTHDTARPEGGGRAAAGDASAPARQWPLLTVLCVAGAGLLIVAVEPFAEAFRIGAMLIGAALLAGGVLRWVVPSVGMLAVRSRFTDLVTYGVMGALIVLLALTAQPKPWLDVPFLQNVVHFTIR
ncbi:DUF3017 domain-containing protein [Streptomyces halstedii]|uniref:DUF3017 domain-containing protein n=1 Tax=Streptomyces halstedii TaxID=1944 RepID=UPI00386CD1AE|nr:DUF3017 domain-containing protein [Streptomyces halstedii]